MAGNMGFDMSTEHGNLIDMNRTKNVFHFEIGGENCLRISLDSDLRDTAEKLSRDFLKTENHVFFFLLNFVYH